MKRYEKGESFSEQTTKLIIFIYIYTYFSRAPQKIRGTKMPNPFSFHGFDSSSFMAGFLSSNDGQLPSGGVNAAAYGLGYGEVGVG